MKQLSNPHERYTIQTFLNYTFMAYASYAVLHILATLWWLDTDKRVSAYAALVCLFYFFFGFKTLRLKKIVSEATFYYRTLKKPLEWIFGLNTVATVVSIFEVVLVGVYLYYNMIMRFFMVLTALTSIVLFIALVCFFIVILVVYPIPFFLLTIRQKAAKKALFLLGPSGRRDFAISDASLSDSEPIDYAKESERVRFSPSVAENHQKGQFEDYQTAPHPVDLPF